MMNDHSILITGEIASPADLEWMRSLGLDAEVCPNDLTETELVSALSGKDAYILGGVEYTSDVVLSSTSQLKVVAFLGVGYHAFIDAKTATAQGIAVTNAPGANARAVAEFTVGLMLDGWRKIAYLAGGVKAGRWHEVRGRDLAGKTLGIVGMGTIGSMVTRIAAQGFGMRVIYTSRSTKTSVEEDISARRVDLPELLAESDVISLHTAYGPQTHGMIGERELAAVKPGALLVNTSEAELVDPSALRNALIDGRLMMSVMDGYYVEPAPTPSDDPYGLLELGDGSIMVTPHTANATDESFRATLAANVESIKNLLEAGDDPRVVNPDFRTSASWLPVDDVAGNR